MALMSDSLEKCSLSKDDKYIAGRLSDAIKHASSAKEILSHLPVSQIYAGKVQSILSKGEQSAKAALGSFISEGVFTENERNTIRIISSASQTFLESLDGFYDKMDHEDYEWIKMNADHYFSEAEDTFSTALKDMGEGTEDFPELNYDGKYSSHIDPKDYKAISGEEVGQDEIMKRLSENIGDGWKVEYSGEGNGNLPSYYFTATDGNNTMHVMYSKTGGNLISASSYNYPDQSKISFKEALSKADAFISDLGHEGMDEEYYEVYNNILSVTYAYSHEGVKCLSDTLTVQVSMKDGKILGYEADSYYKNYYDRKSVSPKIPVEEARRNIHENVNVTGTSLCYLPTDGGNENLCYEFLCENDGGTYLVYIDALTGQQREMMKVSVGENTFRTE